MESATVSRIQEVERGDARSSLPPVFSSSLPEDTAEYMLFAFGDGSGATTAMESKPRALLDRLRKFALQLSESLTKDYIWQRDAFSLQVVSRNGLLYLHGQSSYGDCVEDEWLIVYVLRQLTKSFPGAWARIYDNDGEFLLIEGAKAVPTWITPEIDSNRVWIHDGLLKIIPPEAMQAAGVSLSDRQTPLALADAVRIIRTSPDSLVHLPSLEDEVFRRLQKYPGQITTSIQYARLILPRKIAYLLHSRPRAVAPAVEAFSSRDPLTTKRVNDSALSGSQLQFAPNDLVVVSVKLTRVLYAQLRGQRFTAPKPWPALFARHAETLLQPEAYNGESAISRENLDVTVQLSMKLTFGFEIMAFSADKSSSRVVREIGLILEDLNEDGDDPAALPSDGEIRAWPGIDRESDDSWLNINFEDFEAELNAGTNQTRSEPRAARGTPSEGRDTGPESGFGDSNVQTDLRRIVSQFQSFLNDNDAGIDGADFGEMDRDNDSYDGEEEGEDEDSDVSEGPDNEVSFDEEEFSRLLGEMIGLPRSNAEKREDAAPVSRQSAKAVPAREAGSRAAPRTVHADAGGGVDDDEEESILRLAAQFEAELKDHGALRLNPPKSNKGSKPTAAMDITVGGAAKHGVNADSGSESDDEGELDVDLNLAKNLLESFKGQEGMSGPAGNILSMLGLTLPRDEDDDEKKDS